MESNPVNANTGIGPQNLQQAGFTPATLAQDLAHVERLFEKLGLHKLVRPMRPVALWATYVFVNSFLSIGLLTLLAVITGVPFIFPSLGPTAYQLFFSPRTESSAPRNTLIGHFIGLVCGYAAFRFTGMPGWAAVMSGQFDWRPVAAAALSLSTTAAMMILFNASHPPAGATTLIVSLGIITRPAYLIILEFAVLLLTVQAFCIHRLAGLPYPVWRGPLPSIPKFRWWAELKKKRFKAPNS
jgi:CBS domain-containing membrane protein